MKSLNWKTTLLATTSILTIFAMASATLGNAHATSSAYSFNLAGPNSAMAENTIPGTPIAAGDVLRMTGSGSFDVSAGSANGGGSFTHYKPDGSVFARGVWVVTGFQSFSSSGGPNSGRQGGSLLLTVSIIGPEATFPGLTMQVSGDGTTLPGLFGDVVRGHAVFHSN